MRKDKNSDGDNSEYHEDDSEIKINVYLNLHWSKDDDDVYICSICLTSEKKSSIYIE